MPVAYHYTSSLHLPFILTTGELRPGKNSIRNFPSPDFLWATTSPEGDRTASANTDHPAYRHGIALQVRLSFDPSHFFSWQDVRGTFPQWTAEYVSDLENSARVMKSNPSNWLCRAEPLSLAVVAAIHVRSYSNNRWRELRSTEVRMVQENGVWLAMEIDGKTIATQQSPGPHGTWAYTPADVAAPFESLSVYDHSRRVREPVS